MSMLLFKYGNSTTGMTQHMRADIYISDAGTGWHAMTGMDSGSGGKLGRQTEYPFASGESSAECVQQHVAPCRLHGYGC